MNHNSYKINKKERIGFRCTQSEKEVIGILAERAGMSLSRFVLDAALDKPINSPLSPEEKIIYMGLPKLMSNLNQLTRYAHQGNLQVEEINQAVQRLNELLNKL